MGSVGKVYFTEWMCTPAMLGGKDKQITLWLQDASKTVYKVILN